MVIHISSGGDCLHCIWYHLVFPPGLRTSRHESGETSKEGREAGQNGRGVPEEHQELVGKHCCTMYAHERKEMREEKENDNGADP